MQSAAAYGALSYTKIGGVESIGGFGAATEVVTFQPLKGPQQRYKGPTDHGSLNSTLAVDDADAGQALLAVASQPSNAGLYAVRVTKPDGALRYFQMRVFGMPETIGAANWMITAAPVLEINTAIVKVSSNGTTAPAFTIQPLISPSTGSVGTTFIASNGAASDATSFTRRWLLNGSQIGTGTTVTPYAADSLTLEVTATGSGGSSPTTSNAVTVAAALPTLTIGGPLAFASGAAAGTLVATIGNVPTGATPTLTPNDGRLAIAGDATNGWKVVVGLTVANAGTIALAVAAAGARASRQQFRLGQLGLTRLSSAWQSRRSGRRTPSTMQA
ncbi:hypothetical protein [Sphingomonas sp. BK069]|uniref:hypothetical protein n=1 Tax=Sphingomonas sp. BK069 TaxID=2586979 RepID=UPI001616D7D3|nr:hypothetical protein [Sphingomonas sp. BK069]MBB3348811.1 hypothetical protein [Sphingomonas sp. BK069]